MQIGEDPDYDKVSARYRSEGLGNSCSQNMKIVPVNFNKEHKAMLGHCKMIFEHDDGRIAINPDSFDKLITALRTAVDNDGVLDKEATSYNDIFDAFRLAKLNVIFNFVQSLYSKQIKLIGCTGGTRKEFKEIIDMSKELKVRVWKRFKLEDAKEALQALFCKERDGRILLDINSSI